MADRPGRKGGGGNKKKRRKAARGEAKGGRAPAQPVPPQLPPSPLPAIVRAPLQALLQSLARLIHQVRVFHQEAPCKACDESAPLPPLPDFQKAAGLVSEHSTKLAALFSSPPSLPSPMNCTAAACAMEQAAANLAATYHHISPIYGLALHKEVERCALAILRGVESVINTIISTGTITVPRGLRNTGTVWEFCSRAEKLSKDNKAAVVKDILSQLHLVRDGCREAEQVAVGRGGWEGWGEGETSATGEIGEICEGVQEVKLGGKEAAEGGEGGGGGGGGGGEGSREWNEREKQLAEPCVDLIKLCSEMTGELCRMVVTGGKSGVEEGHARELDQTLFLVLELSPLVDELVGELPAPLLWPECREAGERLAASIARLLRNISQFHYCESSEKWPALRQTYYSSLSSLARKITACEPVTPPTSPPISPPDSLPSGDSLPSPHKC